MVSVAIEQLCKERVHNLLVTDVEITCGPQYAANACESVRFFAPAYKISVKVFSRQGWLWTIKFRDGDVTLVNEGC